MSLTAETQTFIFYSGFLCSKPKTSTVSVIVLLGETLHASRVQAFHHCHNQSPLFMDKLANSDTRAESFTPPPPPSLLAVTAVSSVWPPGEHVAALRDLWWRLQSNRIHRHIGVAQVLMFLCKKLGFLTLNHMLAVSMSSRVKNDVNQEDIEGQCVLKLL